MSDRATERDALAGTAFRTIRSIGRGATAEVLEAEERSTGDRVCVKLLGPELTPKERDRARLEHEVLRALAGHPHVLGAREVNQTPEGRTFIVTALLEGRTLQQELDARGRMPEAEAITLELELLDGLGAAHALGIVHRDVKPANLFVVVGPPRRLVVMDFGLAKVHPPRGGEGGVTPLADPTTAGMMLGTPRYMAPEQIVAQGVDARTDVYAAGLVLYRMVCGKGPFEAAKGLLELVEAQLGVVPAPASTHAPALSAGVDAILLRALQKRPEDRFSSAKEMADALRSLLRAGQMRSRAASPPTEHLLAAGDARRFSADAPTGMLDLEPRPAPRSLAHGPLPKPARPSSSLDALTEPIPGMAQRRPGPHFAMTPDRPGGRDLDGRPVGAERTEPDLTGPSEPSGSGVTRFWSFGRGGRRLLFWTAVIASLALGVLALALRVID